MTKYRLGIDFGTCFSFVGIWDGVGKVTTFGSIANGYGLPSTFYHDNDYPNFTGDEAERLANASNYDTTKTVRYVKQQLLTDKFSLQGGVVTPRFIVTCIIRRLLEIAEKEMVIRDPSGELLKSGAVISVPVSFGEQRYRLIKAAAEDAGLEDVKLILEPVAAAISYCNQLSERAKAPVLVFDLGGGTFDVACLRPRGDLTYDIFEPQGSEHIGGIRWDEMLAEYFVDRLHLLDSSNLAYDRDISIQKLLNSSTGVIESLKRGLSLNDFNDNHYIPVPIFYEIFKNPNIAPNLHINRDTFNSITEPLLKELLKLVEESVITCGLNAFPSHVVLSGGASRMPQVKRGILNVLKNKCGMKTILNEAKMIYSPESAIATGATMSAFGLNTTHMVKNYYNPQDIFIDI